MNINKAMEQATQGPLSAIVVTPGLSCSEGIIASGDVYIARTSSHKDAALLAHCCNHLPKVLEKARILINLISDDESRYEMWKKEIEQLQGAITKASEVKRI